MNVGIIKLHSKLRKKDWYKRSEYVHLWLHLLLLADHDVFEMEWNNSMIRVPEGELVAGRHILSEETGIAETTIEDILTLFEKEGQIRQQKETKYRIITIVKWKDYQQSDNRICDNSAELGGEINLFGERTLNTETTSKTEKNKESLIKERIELRVIDSLFKYQEYRVKNIDSNSKNIEIVNDKYIYNISFNVFWGLYPNKEKKKEAEKRWQRLSFKNQCLVIDDLPKRCEGEKWTKNDGQFIEQPTTYLNGERWLDPIRILKVAEVMNRTIDLTKK